MSGSHPLFHPEPDRETPYRRWYFGLSHGRVGRRQNKSSYRYRNRIPPPIRAVFSFVCCSGCVIIPHKGKIMTNEEIIAKINKILTKVHDVFNQRHKHNRPISDTATRTNNIKTTECFMRLYHYESRSKR